MIDRGARKNVMGGIEEPKKVHTYEGTHVRDQRVSSHTSRFMCVCANKQHSRANVPFLRVRLTGS